jgi:hypothetical protein
MGYCQVFSFSRFQGLSTHLLTEKLIFSSFFVQPKRSWLPGSSAFRTVNPCARPFTEAEPRVLVKWFDFVPCVTQVSDNLF